MAYIRGNRVISPILLMEAVYKRRSTLSRAILIGRITFTEPFNRSVERTFIVSYVRHDTNAFMYRNVL